MFSVVIPLYNKEETIENTLSSVLKQTFSDFEVLIVNDGSSDDGINIVKKFTSDKRLKIIEQENQGVSVARNTGVTASIYEYIAFLDGDDEWEAKYLETVKKAIEKFPEAGMICSAGFNKDFKTNEITYRLFKKYENQIIKINYFENPHVYTHTSATVISKKCFKKTGGFPVGMIGDEDLALFYSVALVTDVVYSGFPMSYYYSNVDSQATQINRNKGYSYVIRRFNITYNFWNSLGRKNIMFPIFLKYELRHILLYLLKDNNYDAIDSYFENLKPGLLDLFSKLERLIYRYKYFNKLGIIYIYATKVLWRLSDRPVVTKAEPVLYK